jgi:DNA-binding XRE family transcriptional regulator
VNHVGLSAHRVNPWPQRLRAFRAAFTPRLTQQKAAEMAGVTRRCWIRWEMGQRQPSRSTTILLGMLIDNQNKSQTGH